MKHAGRDPRLVWYEKGKHWVMAVYDEHERKQWIAFYTSPDLKTWTFASRIEGFFECPDLFEMPVGRDAQGDPPETKWVLYAADGKYLVGDFRRQGVQAGLTRRRSNSGTATSTRRRRSTTAPRFGQKARIQIGWANGVTFPGMPFNQQMTVPVNLYLEDENGKAMLHAHPVPEFDSLRKGKPAFTVPPDGNLAVTKQRVLADDLDAFEVEFQCVPAQNAGFMLDLRGTKLVFDAKKQTLTCKDVTAPLRLPDDNVTLRVFVDRGSIEVFAGGTAMSIAAIPDEKNRKVELTTQGGEIVIRSANIYRMKSAWEK